MIDKIRKLLALSSNNSNEEEAASALSKARKMMIEHGVSDDMLLAPKEKGIEYGSVHPTKSFERVTASAASKLMGTRDVWYARQKATGFMGRPENIVATEILWSWINEQVETFYKMSLPKGMSQAERAQYRKSFKWACAVRINSRAIQIVKTDSVKAQSFALVLVDEIDLKIKDDGLVIAKEMKQTIRHAAAAAAGRAAGDQVKLNREITQ